MQRAACDKDRSSSGLVPEGIHSDPCVVDTLIIHVQNWLHFHVSCCKETFLQAQQKLHNVIRYLLL